MSINEWLPFPGIITLIEALKKKTLLFCQKEIRAARKLLSEDIIISLETSQAKTQLEENKDWIPAVFTAEVKISPRIFPVLVYRVQTKDFKPENLEKTKRQSSLKTLG